MSGTLTPAVMKICSTATVAKAGCACLRCRSACGIVSATFSRSTPSVRCCVKPSTSVSPISILPITTARLRERGRELWSPAAGGFCRLSRRADYLHQSGLRHVAGTVWLGRLAQISARQPRPEPEAYGPNMWIFSIPIAWMKTRRWKRPLPRWPMRCRAVKRCMSEFRPIQRRARRKWLTCFANGKSHCSSISRRTTCLTAGWIKPACWRR